MMIIDSRLEEVLEEAYVFMSINSAVDQKIRDSSVLNSREIKCIKKVDTLLLACLNNTTNWLLSAQR